MLLLGIDLGTSSIKVSVIDSQTQTCLSSARYPDDERTIISQRPGWAEQDPEQWWSDIKKAIARVNSSGNFNPKEIGAIGIAYQMHGLVIVDKQQRVLRPSIIWCDSRAVDIGNEAFDVIGADKCLSTLLNSPGNFTASKLAWVKQNEPSVYARIDRVLLPGDFIAMRMTGEATTTTSALSEGILWNFRESRFSEDVMGQFGFDPALFPPVHTLFSSHGSLRADMAEELSLRAGIPVAYKAGDQPNNALSLNVLQPGEVAATAGTSGVIYGVSDTLAFDRESRINSFAHVNHEGSDKQTRIGVLLCINGVGIFNRWIRAMMGNNLSYEELNGLASRIEIGSNGLLALPFGNGAERMLNNRVTGAQFCGLDFNQHGPAHLARAVQEGIACAFRYGLDIMRENGIDPRVIRASRSNLFLSDTFTDVFAGLNQVAIEFYEGDGSIGAAVGAGIGAGIYEDAVTAASMTRPSARVEPLTDGYEELYSRWKQQLSIALDR